MPYLDIAKEREHGRLHYRRRREEMFAYLGGACRECGSTTDLHLHHIDPTTKSFNPTNKWSAQWSVLAPELDKCELLCEPCHKGHHAAKHGSKRKFDLGCKCDECREVGLRYYREYWRERRRLARVMT